MLALWFYFPLIAKQSLVLKCDSNTGIYDVYLEHQDQREAQFLKNMQICIKLPTQNLFIYDIQSASNSTWNSKRHSAPKEMPQADFFVFSTPQAYQISTFQKLFSFKIAGKAQKGEVEIANIKSGTINLSSQVSISNAIYEILPSENSCKAPVFSISDVKNKDIQSFNISMDYLKEEVNIFSNWLEKSGVVYFYLYDLNGQLVKSYKTDVEIGAQHFNFTYSNLPNGIYFVKAKFNNWETILNDGIVTSDDWEAVNN
jgi:hypothetical protein